MTELTIDEAARELHRSYSWVYERLPQIVEECFKKGGIVFITRSGLAVLAEMSAKSPKRGRPRKGHELNLGKKV